MPHNEHRVRHETPTHPSRPPDDTGDHERAVSESVDAFRRILRALRLAATKTQMVAGVSAAQLFVLRALQDGTEASLSDIASRTMTDRSSVAAVVDRLVEAELVERGTSGADRRRAAITITTAGRKVLRRAPEPPTSLLVAGLRQIDEAQRRALAEGLRALTDAMGLSEQEAGMLFEDHDDAVRRRTRRRGARP